MEIFKQVNILSPFLRISQDLGARSAQYSFFSFSLRVRTLKSDIRYMTLAEQGKETLL